MRQVGIALLAGILGTGCAGATAVGATAIASTVVVAGGVGAANLASGKCFTECPGDTFCNPQTGLCDRVSASACGGECPIGQVCDVSDPIPRCVDDTRLQPVPPPTPTGTLP